MNRPRLFLPTPAHWNRNSNVRGWFATEIPKDSTRVLWDGGLTRDFPRPLWDWKEPGTGLFNERGEVVVAPDRFLNSLPCLPLDGFLHTVEGHLVLSVIGLPSLPEFYRVGDILGGDQLFSIEADSLFDLVTNSPVASEWRQITPDSSFTQEVFHATENLSGPAELALFHQIRGIEDLKYDRQYLLRSPASVWAGAFTESWLEVNTLRPDIVTVNRNIGGVIFTPVGSFPSDSLSDGVHSGDLVEVHVNKFGFIVSLVVI